MEITFGKKNPAEDPIAGATTVPSSDAVEKLFGADKDAGFFKKLFSQLYDSKASSDAMAARAKALGMSDDAMSKVQQEFFKSPLNASKIDLTDKVKGSALGNTARLLGANIKAHPLQAAGTGVGIASNIAGLVDNDNFLGQGVGLVAGAVLPKYLGLGAYGTLNTALAGGAIGSLFDTLTESKEKEKEKYAKLPASETTY